MTRSAKFFRYLWRVDAILICVAAGAVAFGVGALLVGQLMAGAARRREAAVGPLVGKVDSSEQLILGRGEPVAGTNVIRANLISHDGGSGFSSGGYAESRNTLFIEPGAREARWLLPDHDHVIVQSMDIVLEEPAKQGRTIATAALVKPRGGDRQTTSGLLLLLDAGGRRIAQVADDVRELHVAAIAGGEVNLLYERQRRLVSATFDKDSLEKRREQALDIPPLKGVARPSQE
jgi:hypothetical protein